MLNGVLPVYKPEDCTSYDVIRKIKEIICQEARRQKIGHAGTLDPFATGVLPIVFGEATKAIPFLSEAKKEYIATIKFGSFTDTDDRTGRIIESFDKVPSLEEIKNIIINFRGKIRQIPPKYSALKIDGKRAYELARTGIEINLKEREVNIFEIIILNYCEKDKILNIKISCSSGTYIRSIARDMGKKLGCGAYLEELKRTKSCNIDIESCVFLKKLFSYDSIQEKLIPVAKLIDYPSLEWEKDEHYIYEGRTLYDKIFPGGLNDGRYKIVKKDKLLAIIEKRNNNYSYLRVFL